jgi:hypothetical protein
MKTVILNRLPFDYDETLPYADFTVKDGKPDFNIICGVFAVEALADLERRRGPPWNHGFCEFFKLASRWVHEAPRKRGLRGLILHGMKIMSTECFFVEDGGEKIIDALENWGKLAVRVLQRFGETGVGPIQQDDPARPATPAEVLRERA